MEICGYKHVIKELPQTCNCKKRDKSGNTSFHHLTFLSFARSQTTFLLWRLGTNFGNFQVFSRFTYIYNFLIKIL
ncbi:hypothetical protein TB2_028509 [Malus domestica]